MCPTTKLPRSMLWAYTRSKSASIATGPSSQACSLMVVTCVSAAAGQHRSCARRANTSQCSPITVCNPTSLRTALVTFTGSVDPLVSASLVSGCVIVRGLCDSSFAASACARHAAAVSSCASSTLRGAFCSHLNSTSTCVTAALRVATSSCTDFIISSGITVDLPGQTLSASQQGATMSLPVSGMRVLHMGSPLDTAVSIHA